VLGAQRRARPQSRVYARIVCVALAHDERLSFAWDAWRGAIQNRLDPSVAEIERGGDRAARRAGASQEQNIARQPDGDAVGFAGMFNGRIGRGLLGAIRAYMRHGSRSFC